LLLPSLLRLWKRVAPTATKRHQQQPTTATGSSNQQAPAAHATVSTMRLHLRLHTAPQPETTTISDTVLAGFSSALADGFHVMF